MLAKKLIDGFVFRRNLARALPLFLIFVLVVFGAFYLKPEITGFITASKEINHTDAVNLVVDSDREYYWFLEHPGDLKSLKLDGSITTNGTARVYLEHNNRTYLVFDSELLSESGSLITGFAVLNETADNETIQTEASAANQAMANENQPANNETGQADNQTAAETEQPQAEKTITVSIAYNSGTAFDADDNGIETTTGAIDFTALDTDFSWEADESKLCTRWSTYSLDSGGSAAVCYGNSDCCAFAGLASERDSWNEVFYSSYGRYGATLSNAISAQVIYYDVSLDPNEPYAYIYYSNWSSLNATYYFEETSFSDVCAETCLLSGFNESFYKLIIDVDNAVLTIDKMEYSILNATNVTEEENITIELKDKKGKKLGHYKLNKTDEGHDLELDSLPEKAKGKKSEVKIKNIRNLNQLKKLEAYIDETFDDEIKTDVFAAADGLVIDNAEITLAKKGNVNAIVKCADFNFETFSCSEWQRTDIPFTETADTISFTVTEFDTYAGAEIEIINVHSYPSLYGNWTVMFNTIGTANLTVTATRENNYTSEYTRWSDESEDSNLYDLRFLEVRCGNETKQYEWQGVNCFEQECSVFIAGYNCNETGYEISKVLTAKKHVLKFSFGGQTAYAYNAVGGININFTPPTPANGTTTTNTSVQINISITNASDLAEMKWNWNGTNYTFYNDSLVLMFNFDNVSAIGDNASYAVDVSKYGNNGTILGAVWNSSGRYGSALSFDGSNDVVVWNNTQSFNLSDKNFTISMWVKPSTVSPTYQGFFMINAHYGLYMRMKEDKIALLISSNGASWDVWLSPSGEGTVSVFTANEWHHVVLVRRGDNFNITVNNINAVSVSQSGVIAYNPSKDNGIGLEASTAGSFTSGYAWPFNGSIDEVRVWNRSMSAAEIKQHYYSNLNKYDTDKWAFYTNQTISEPLGSYVYNYSGCAKDTSGNENCTETRILTIQAIYPSINFTSPTPPNGTTTTNTSAQINISITNASDLNEFKWNWNGTNYTFYNDSLVLMFNFDNVSALGEGNNNLAKDVSKYNNNGTCVGMGDSCNWTTGKYRSALSFDGVDDYVNISSNLLNNASSATISAWIYLRNYNPTSQSTIISDRDASGNNDFQIGITPDDNTPHILFFNIWTTSEVINMANSSANISLNTWTHVTGTYNATNILVYINGVQDGFITNITGNISSNSTSSSIGSIRGSSATAFNGSIDEVRIWNRSLTAAEIKQHYYSNLNKYDTDKWNFYTNQSNLTTGTYTYYGSAKDTAGNENTTETRILTIGDVIPTTTLVSPADGNISITRNVTFICNATDDQNLNNISLYHNISGTFALNDTWHFYDSIPTENAMVLYMKFNNDSSVGENDSLVYDYSGYGNNGTIYGSVYNLTNKKFGAAAMQFDGVDDYINVGSSLDPVLEGSPASFSISMWVNVFGGKNSGDRWTMLIADHSNAANTGFFIGYSNTSNSFGDTFALGSSWGDTYTAGTGVNSVELNKFYYLTYTVEGATVKVYLDGNLKSNATGTRNNLGDITRSLTIGYDVNVGLGNSHFNGTIDELVIYNRSLSASEIKKQYMRRNLTTAAQVNWTITNISYNKNITWNCLSYDNGSQSDWGNANWSVYVRSDNIPSIAEVMCNNATAWINCSSMAYGINLTQIRANCTDPDNDIANVTYLMTNLDDNAAKINGSYATQEGNAWYYNYSQLIRDSGNWTLNISCTDSGSLQANYSQNWSLAWGVLVPYIVTTDKDAAFNVSFNFTAGVNCTIGECGSLNATLDPEQLYNSIKEYAVNVQSNANKPITRYEATKESIVDEKLNPTKWIYFYIVDLSNPPPSITIFYLILAIMFLLNSYFVYKTILYKKSRGE